jgi:hypothetical protein
MRRRRTSRGKQRRRSGSGGGGARGASSDDGARQRNIWAAADWIYSASRTGRLEFGQPGGAGRKSWLNGEERKEATRSGM